jgi:UDP-N-acetylmuramoylalanine--D-glutamate ligase
MNLQGKSMLVLGLGESGLSMVKWLHQAGARLRVADTRATPPGLEAVQALGAIDLQLGALTEATFDGIEMIAISPGVPMAQPWVQAAQARGVPVIGDIELFAWALQQRQAQGYAPKVVAVTGTNGKTTVTAMVEKLSLRAGKKALACGNISPAALDAWMAAQAQDVWPDVWVIELSSYQLECCPSLNPDAAVMLNLSEDHLDRYENMAAYGAAKARIFMNNSHQVLNRDDAASLGMRRKFIAKHKKDTPQPIYTFGSSAPQGEGDFGLVDMGGVCWLAVGNAEAAHDGGAAPIKRLMPIDALQVQGLHNATNALAALALGRAIGLPMAPMLKALTEYQGEPHRVELIATLAQVQYYDDSKGTNVGSTVAALSGLLVSPGTPTSAKIVLIAGGDGKGQDFSPLTLPIAAYARAVCLIGRDAERLAAVIAETGVPTTQYATLEEATTAAAHLAQPGDKVLLSPACASLDMFRNYKHRAEVFVATVERLKAELPSTPAATAVPANVIALTEGATHA